MKKMITMIMLMASAFAWAGDDAPETVVASDEEGVWLGPDELVVASGEKGVWLGPDEIVVASDVKGVWLGPDEIVVAFDEADFALMPSGAQKIGDEVFMYVNAEGALVVFGEGLKSPQFNLEILAESIVFRTAIRADGSLHTVPTVVVPGHAMVLYGTESLENPDWREIDPIVPMQESDYHFFKFVLK
ncbi:MAG: hypothetical protein Q4G65_17910 [bacterium]|nr:hypothetical protein [bacterium]